MSGANKHRAEIVAKIGGNDRILRLTSTALVALQSYLGGRGPLSLIQRGGLDYAEAVAVIHFGLLGAGVEGQSMEQTLALVDEMKISDVTGIALVALFAAVGLDPAQAKTGKKKG